MKGNDFKKYLAIIILPLVILLSMTIKPLITYYQGEEILIKTKPYDPRNVFRGDYVSLNYEIAEVSIDKVPKEFKDINVSNKLINKKLYAILKKNGNYYVVDYISFEKPKNKLYLTGKYEYPIFDENLKESEKVEYLKEAKNTPSVKGISVSYNLDKYFVPENTGHKLEDLSRKGSLIAKVKVWKGYSYLMDIF